MRLIGVEAAGEGVEPAHTATHRRGEPGVLHGALSLLIQDDDGQVAETHSISAGLDYPGVGPEHSYLATTGRATYETVDRRRGARRVRAAGADRGDPSRARVVARDRVDVRESVQRSAERGDRESVAAAATRTSTPCGACCAAMARTEARPKQRLADAFAAGREEGRALLMPFLVAGYPTDAAFVEAAHACGEAGADVLEIGIPFSDPVMDGPVIQEAAFSVLSRSPRIASCDRARRPRRLGPPGPAFAMTYYNLPFRAGLVAFASSLADAGLCGAILPDLSVEESREWRKATSSAGIAPVFMAAVTSTEDRLQAIGVVSEGFVYAASTLGVTGVRAALSTGARDLVSGSGRPWTFRWRSGSVYRRPGTRRRSRRTRTA